MNEMSHPAIPWKDPSRLLLAGGVVAMIVYVALRAIYVSFTHDEAFTFFHYVLKPIDATLDVTYTNNHLLNSLLARFCSTMFGNSEFSLRLPNVIGAALFFAFGARLLVRLPAGKWFALIAFAGLALNTFTIDFFGLCRGYGLSLGLLMTSFYFQFNSFANNRTTRYEWLALLFAALATSANYTLLNLFLIQSCINLVRIVIKMRMHRTEPVVFFNAMGSGFALLIAVTLFLKFFIGMMLNLNKLGNFNFGGDNNMWIDCVGSLAAYSFYQLARYWQSGEMIYAGAGVAVLVTGIAVVTRMVKRREWNPVTRFILFLTLLIVGCGVAIWLQFHLLHVPYPKDRTVMYFIPLFALLALSLVTIGGRMKALHIILALLFFAPAVVNQLFNFNLYYVQFWVEDNRMREVTHKTIEEINAAVPLNRPVIVVTTHEASMSFSYYVYTANADNVQGMIFRDATWISIADYAIGVPVSDEGKVFGPYELRAELYGKQIFVRTPAPAPQSGKLIGSIDFENNLSEMRQTGYGFKSMFSDLLSEEQMYSKAIADTISNGYQHGSLYHYIFDIQCSSVPTKVIAVLSIMRGDSLIEWKSMNLDAFCRGKDTWRHAEIILHSGVKLEEGDAVQFYFINTHKDPVFLDNFSVTELPPKP